MEVYGYLAVKTGYYAVVRGTTICGLAVRLIVTSAILAAETSSMVFGLSVPLCEFFLPSDLFPFFILSRRLRKFFSVCRGRVYSVASSGVASLK
jgi:hypothetical protein